MRRYPSAKDLAKHENVGRYSAGPNLLMQISAYGTRSWIFRYTTDGKPHHMGLGSCDLLTLAEARDRAHEIRRQLKLFGIDPLEAKRQAKRERLLATTRQKRFRQAALEYVAAHEATWRGSGSRQQWLQSLEKYASPVIGDMPVATVDVAAVLAVLDRAKAVPETQKRLKNRLASILDWCAARELRPADNPARRPKLLPARKKRVEHFAAMPYHAVPGFLAELRQDGGVWAGALELLVLTAARPGEVLGMQWGEVDLPGATWVIPETRMKSAREHRIPLPPRAAEILAALPRGSDGGLVFPGRGGRRAWPMALVKQLRRMGHIDLTAHGFRSAFRVWASEQTAFAHEVVEAALAHAIPSAVERAYRRTDLFDRRRQLMLQWADFCSRPNVEGDVVPMRKVLA